MGDVNNPADVRNEGYDLITNAGWQDAYAVAATRIGSATVPPAIDGWKGNEVPLRIDYLYSDHPNTMRYAYITPSDYADLRKQVQQQKPRKKRTKKEKAPQYKDLFDD